MIVLSCMIVCLCFEGCGVYSFSGSTLPPHLKTVGVPLFENETPEFGIDQQVTDLVIEGIKDDNTLKIADPRDADALIRGTIVRVTEGAGQYNQQEEVSDYRIHISLKVTFEDVHKRETLWEETLTQWGSYTDTADRDAGIEAAVEKLTSDILNRAVSGW
jgi:hypothetical protein